MARIDHLVTSGTFSPTLRTGIALALGIPGEAVMGLVGPHFVGGAVALVLRRRA